MEEQRGLRITTWNVNGIRNPFGYQPWRQERTFAAMFEILEADIVVMQETKIQRKDLRDDMVLVPGWDVFFSLPKHKKGYSGVAVYTRNSVCAPIRAEEGITGILTAPNSATSFCDLPKDQQIGGYPTNKQISDCSLDLTALDSEGRCVILEFPAFVLIGTYCPANRDESRDEFRLGFLNAVDARVRNLVALGKRVFWTGDMNIIREELDTANIEERLKKQETTVEEYFSTPARRMFNQLLVGGKVFGEKDEGREKPVMWDICRSFHPERKGMFTCWDQKLNARPGNFGSRIDYVLCDHGWKDWFCESNIQEGLMGSDHCPVYAVLKQKVEIEGKDVDIRDIMSAGMFKDGIRAREWSAKDLLLMSAKLIPEFDRRRSIRDMFTKKPSTSTEESFRYCKKENEIQETMPLLQVANAVEGMREGNGGGALALAAESTQKDSTLVDSQTSDSTISKTSFSMSQSPTLSTKPAVKRPNESSSSQPQKRGKSAAKGNTAKGQSGRGQSSLIGFFKPKNPPTDHTADSQKSNGHTKPESASVTVSEPATPNRSVTGSETSVNETPEDASPSKPFNLNDQETVVDPIVAKESWSKLLGKRILPRCEHNEPCISYTTKKPGANCGRSFYLCPRPLGPSGHKEKNTQWRCGAFIWSSDWTGD